MIFDGKYLQINSDTFMKILLKHSEIQIYQICGMVIDPQLELSSYRIFSSQTACFTSTIWIFDMGKKNLSTKKSLYTILWQRDLIWIYCFFWKVPINVMLLIYRQLWQFVLSLVQLPWIGKSCFLILSLLVNSQGLDEQPLLIWRRQVVDTVRL